MGAKQQERHQRFMLELREVLERHHAVLDTPGDNGSLDVHVVYMDDPLVDEDALSLYPIYGNDGEYCEQYEEGEA